MMMMNQQQQHPPPLMNMNQSTNQVLISNQRNLFALPYTIPQPINRIDFRPQVNPMWTPQHQFRNSTLNKKSLAPRSNWKGKKVNYNPNGRRRKRMALKESLIQNRVKTPHFKNPKDPESQYQNRVKTQIFDIRSAPSAPRNTTSFIIRSKKGGGIAPFVSPCSATPSVLSTPVLSPSREILVDMVKEEWGVDGYGSMKGLIWLRSSPGHEMEEGGSSGSDVEDHAEVEKRLDHDLSRFEMVYNYPNGDDDSLENGVDDQGGSSLSDVEEHVEVEKRLDHDFSRFEMVYNYPNGVDDLLDNGVDDQGGSSGSDVEHVEVEKRLDHDLSRIKMVSNYVNEVNELLENGVDDQDAHIAKLEKDNLNLKEKLFFMEREVGDLRRRMVCLERASYGVEEINGGEVVVNRSKKESDSRNSSKEDYIGSEKDDAN